MRPLSGGRFFLTVTWRIVAFVVISLFVPEIITAIQTVTGCDRVGGACAAVSVLTGTLLRPILLVLLALALLRPSWRRARMIGLPAAVGLSVPLLVLLDWKYLTTLGARWSFNFDLGIFNSGLPFFTILALLIIITFALSRTCTGPDDRLWRRCGMVGKAGLIAVLATILAAAVSAGFYVAWASNLGRGGGAGFLTVSPLLANGFRVGRAASIVSLAAMLGVLWIMVGELLHRPAKGIDSGT